MTAPRCKAKQAIQNSTYEYKGKSRTEAHNPARAKKVDQAHRDLPVRLVHKDLPDLLVHLVETSWVWIPR
jgi:hypothetical protein